VILLVTTKDIFAAILVWAVELFLFYIIFEKQLKEEGK
jgi:hypothetical protein